MEDGENHEEGSWRRSACLPFNLHGFCFNYNNFIYRSENCSDEIQQCSLTSGFWEDTHSHRGMTTVNKEKSLLVHFTSKGLQGKVMMCSGVSWFVGLFLFFY